MFLLHEFRGISEFITVSSKYIVTVSMAGLTVQRINTG